MGDSSGAEILGNAFRALAACDSQTARVEARKLWLTTRGVDCTHDEMYCDDALIVLGLAHRLDSQSDLEYLSYEEAKRELAVEVSASSTFYLHSTDPKDPNQRLILDASEPNLISLTDCDVTSNSPTAQILDEPKERIWFLRHQARWLRDVLNSLNLDDPAEVTLEPTTSRQLTQEPCSE